MYIPTPFLCIRLFPLFGQRGKSEVSEPTVEKASHVLIRSFASLSLSERNITHTPLDHVHPKEEDTWNRAASITRHLPKVP